MHKFILTNIVLVLLLCFAGPVNGQQDDMAKRILDQLAEKTRKAPSVSIDFTIIMSDLKDDFREEFDGTLVMKGDKYRLSVMGMESWFDGSSTYTFMADVNEVIISDPDEEGGLMANPSGFFNIYHDEFRYKLAGELTRDGKRVYEIDLHPIDINQNFHTVKLFINQHDTSLNSAVIAAKDGNRYTFLVNSFDNTINLPESYFVFNKSDYPGLEVIDMRW